MVGTHLDSLERLPPSKKEGGMLCADNPVGETFYV